MSDDEVTAAFKDHFLPTIVDVALHNLREIPARHGESTRVWARRFVGLDARLGNPTTMSKHDWDAVRVLVDVTLGHLKEVRDLMNEAGIDIRAASMAAGLFEILDCADTALQQGALQA